MQKPFANNKNFNKTIYVYWDKEILKMKPLIKSIYLNNVKIAKKNMVIS